MKTYTHNHRTTIAIVLNCLALSSLIPKSTQFTPQNINVRRHSLTRVNVLNDPSGLSSIPPSDDNRNSNNNRNKDRIDDNARESEFAALEPREESLLRKQRMEREQYQKSQFVSFGNELWELRSKLDDLSVKLIEAISEAGTTDTDEIRNIRRDILELESQDAEHVYTTERELLEHALEEERMDDAAVHRERALTARGYMPQFNYEGLWLGKYGDHGFEMINVTYVGDTLIARKVTGDKNVPAGELTFQADLTPPKFTTDLSKNQKEVLPNIALSENAAKKWGTSELKRSSGLGQVAEEGFVGSQWMDGQLIMINEEYFSFAWLPIDFQIFFGRPSPELSLKMLQESSVPSMEDDLDVLKNHVLRCFEETADTFEENDPSSCIYYDGDSDLCSFE
jgi:hypothetical protein